MFIGLIAAILHGVLLPLLVVVFGQTTDIFANEYITREVARSVGDLSMNDINCTELNTICSTTEVEICEFFVNGTLYVTGDDLIEEINRLVIVCCVLGVVAFVCGWLHVSLFQCACERQLQIIRKKFFPSILRQDIKWFDKNSVRELNSRISK